MKIDLDAIFYIILSIIILVVSGLGSRRRKLAQQMKSPSSTPTPSGTSERDENEILQERTPVVDPFDRLEQILTGRPRYETMEGESLEKLVDEEEEISTPSYFVPEEKTPDLIQQKEKEHKKRPAEGLFEDVNEVTRAVIYSEILPRKYF